jgi:hypothetical protein
VARQPLDAPEDLPKETPGQVTFGQLEHELPRMSDEASAGLGWAENTIRDIESSR